jgi:hypothetical protein
VGAVKEDIQKFIRSCPALKEGVVDVMPDFEVMQYTRVCVYLFLAWLKFPAATRP